MQIRWENCRKGCRWSVVDGIEPLPDSSQAVCRASVLETRGTGPADVLALLETQGTGPVEVLVLLKKRLEMEDNFAFCSLLHGDRPFRRASAKVSLG